MNVFRKEMRFNIKSFLLWALVVFVFVFAGIIKYTGVEAGGTDMINSLLAAFPRIVLATMGFSNVDIATFGGFYALLEVYVTIIVAIYAVHLGNNAISREQVDKTYEFLFTKPRSRTGILGAKLVSAVLFICLIGFLNFAFSQAAYSMLNLPENMLVTFGYFSVAQVIVGMVFLSLGALLAVMFSTPEEGARAGNASVLVCYFVGVAYSSIDNVQFLRVLTPFKYFDQSALLSHEIELPFFLLSGMLVVVCLAITFLRFRKRDLGAA